MRLFDLYLGCSTDGATLEKRVCISGNQHIYIQINYLDKEISMEKRKNPTGFRLTDQDKEKLEQLAKESGMSRGKVISNLIKSAKSVKVKVSTED